MRSHLTNLKYSSILVFMAIPQLLFAESKSVSNPLIFGNDPGTNGVAELITAIVNILRIILTPIVVVFIIYAGFLFVTARGNPETLSKAKKALIYGLIGGLIILGANAIGLIVKDTADQF